MSQQDDVTIHDRNGCQTQGGCWRYAIVPNVVLPHNFAAAIVVMQMGIADHTVIADHTAIAAWGWTSKGLSKLTPRKSRQFVGLLWKEYAVVNASSSASTSDVHDVIGESGRLRALLIRNDVCPDTTGQGRRRIDHYRFTRIEDLANMFVRPQPLGRVFRCGSWPCPSNTKDLKMFTVTEAACVHLAKTLAEVETPENENVVLRMSQRKDRWGLTLGQAGPEDTTFAHEGVTVLAIGEELSQALANNTLDVETTENRTALKLRAHGPMIKDAGGIPAHGNQRSKWDAGCRSDFPNPDYR